MYVLFVPLLLIRHLCVVILTSRNGKVANASVPRAPLRSFDILITHAGGGGGGNVTSSLSLTMIAWLTIAASEARRPPPPPAPQQPPRSIDIRCGSGAGLPPRWPLVNRYLTFLSVVSRSNRRAHFRKKPPLTVAVEPHGSGGSLSAQKWSESSQRLIAVRFMTGSAQNRRPRIRVTDNGYG